MRLKLGLAIIVTLALVGAGWHKASAPVYVAGQVENQIRRFGPQIAPQLVRTSRFDHAQIEIAGAKVGGYRPQLEVPHAPAGLLPVEQQAWEAMAKRQQQATEPALTPFFPERYSDGTEVRGQGMAITLRPLGSTAAQARIENGKLVYHEAYADTDSMQVISDGLTEEFLLLHHGRAPQRFEYEFAAMSGVKEITLKDNAIHFKSAKGRELEIAAPWLVETGGARTAKAVHWELTPVRNGKAWPKLALVVASEKPLHYPVLIDPSWTTTLGSMKFARYGHTATLLNSGRVLVSGGADSSSNPLSDVELYDPGTGTWSITGGLNVARYDHTGTLLPNGMVLVAGGSGKSAVLGSAELYNPATGTWAITGSLAITRYNHAATLLPNGNVLVSGGVGGPINVTLYSVLSSAETYVPATGAWNSTRSMSFARTAHTSTLLSNGQVLVAGGGGSSFNAINGAELYNPATGTWKTTGNLGTARQQHTATLLPNHLVLVAGGQGVPGYPNSVLASAELYDPTSGTWTATGGLNQARELGTATLLPNGLVLVTGGITKSSEFSSTPSAELYSVASGTWTVTSNLTVARENQSATLLASGQVLITGGITGTGSSVLSSTELYDPTQATFTGTGFLNTARYEHTATLLPSGLVLVAGGYGSNGVALANCELYNPATATWTSDPTGNTLTLNTARAAFTATLLTNGKVLAVGGAGVSGYLASTELYNPATEKWTATGNLTTPRAGHTATLLASGQVLVAGGYENGAGTAEVYNVAKGAWKATGNLNTARYEHTATLLPNGQVLIAGGQYNDGINQFVFTNAELYNPTTAVWTPTGSLTDGRYSHTATLLPSGKVLVAGGYGETEILASAELYNPANGKWATTGSLNTPRVFHDAALLPSGQVMVEGGFDGSILATAEVYNPATGDWTAQSDLNTNNQRYLFGMTLLPSGKVLLEGGYGTSVLSTAELFDPGLGFTSAKQPVVKSLSYNAATEVLSITGSGFAGGPEASGGGTNNSASNIPVLQLESLGNEQTVVLPLNPKVGFTATTFSSSNLNPALFPSGYGLLTMFVNGTPSNSTVVLVP